MSDREELVAKLLAEELTPLLLNFSAMGHTHASIIKGLELAAANLRNTKAN